MWSELAELEIDLSLKPRDRPRALIGRVVSKPSLPQFEGLLAGCH
jgi:hypothetical protein